MRTAAVLVALAWIVSGIPAAASAPPAIDPLRAAATDADGLDVSYDPETYASMDAALEACRRGRVAPAVCTVHAVVTRDGTEWSALVATWEEDDRKMNASELLARRRDETRVTRVFWVATSSSVATTGPAEYFTSPAGPLVRVTVRFSGTGAFNRDVLFVWKDGRWREIDAARWLADVKLAPGYGIWKGVEVEPKSFTARSSVWREGDGNCCPSGGRVRVELELRDRALVIRAQSWDRDDATE